MTHPLIDKLEALPELSLPEFPTDDKYIRFINRDDAISIAKEYLEQTGWKPIAEAPKKSVWVLISGGLCQSVCIGSNKWHPTKEIHLGKKFIGEDYYTVNDYFYVKPTHFMLLPQPPAKGTENE